MHLFSRSRSHLPIGFFGPPPLRIPVHLGVAELRSHLHVTGVTGGGKSRFLAHLALALLARGEAITLLDPHGDTARLVLGHLVARGAFDDPAATETITYLDLPAAARQHRATALNILEQPTDTPTIARLVLEALRRAWPALEGGVAPAFENAVLAGVSVLIRHKLPLVFLHDLLTDAAWRGALLADVADPTVRGFFRRLDGWGARERALYLESTLRRAFLLGFSPVLRNSLGQRANGLRWRERFDRGQSLIVNLALPDPDARRLIGCLLTVSAEQAALQRADVAPGERGRGHTLILDEFADVASQSGVALAHILEQCRKFGLALVLANQTGGQLDARVRGALANVGTAVCFRLGREDAEEAARQLGATDPWRVKHVVRDRDARRRMHPLYASLAEQREGWAQTIQRLPPRRVVVRRANGKVALLTTPALPDPVVDPVRLAAVEGHFLADWFTPNAVVAGDLAALRGPVAPPALRRRTARRTA